MKKTTEEYYLDFKGSGHLNIWFNLYFQAGQVSDNNVKQKRMRKLLSCDSAFCTLRQVSKEKCQTKQAALLFVLQNATSWKFQYYYSNNGGEIITLPRPFPSSFH